MSMVGEVVARHSQEHLLEDSRRDRRYDRLLQRIAGEAMRAADSQEPHARKPSLDEALTVVMAATQSQSVALLLFDASTNRLLVSSSAGIADEQLVRHVVSLDPSTVMATTICTDDGTTFVGDAETTELDVSDELRELGIHALLGVRLRAESTLRGVLCVGLCERREFGSADVRRLEDLGVSLAMYLENARLRAALRDRSRSIAEEGQLREAFVSVLMHDLTGPLEAAKSGARRLREPGSVQDPKALATRVLDELERAEWMVRGLLDVHRIRTGQPLAIHFEECDLAAVARDAIEELRASHGDRFILHAGHRVSGVWSAEQLRRAIWNLAVNGIDHGATGRPVAVTVVAVPGGAEVRVHNEGPAISSEVQAELFHPFSLPGSAVRGARAGWGLGLTFVWGCVEAHGGKVIVESRAGEGTTFRIRLPYDSRPYAV